MIPHSGIVTAGQAAIFGPVQRTGTEGGVFAAGRILRERAATEGGVVTTGGVAFERHGTSGGVVRAARA